MLSKGIYAAVVVPVLTDFGDLACQFGHSSKKGTAQVAVCFEVLRGPEAGKRMSWIGYLTDTTEERTLKTLRICGFTGDDMDKFADQRPTNEVQIDVGEEEDQNGRTRTKINWVNDPSFGGGMKMANALSGSDLRKFGAQFKSKLKSLPAIKTTEAVKEASAPVGSAGSSPQSNEGGETPSGSDDDQIPF
jgi:hypothetical protein